MEPEIYPTLRLANAARQLEWTGLRATELTWCGTELAGEIGETAELLMQSAESHFKRSYEWLVHLGEEVADGLICIDLAAMSAGCDQIMPHVTRYPNSVEMSALLGIAVGGVCNTLKKLERERRGWPGSRTSTVRLSEELAELSSLLFAVANHHGLDPERATADKFNRTSEKVGLRTRLAL